MNSSCSGIDNASLGVGGDDGESCGASTYGSSIANIRQNLILKCAGVYKGSINRGDIRCLNNASFRVYSNSGYSSS